LALLVSYLGIVKKFVLDSIDAAREMGIEAIRVYVENFPPAAEK
jgi:hypothetical protein